LDLTQLLLLGNCIDGIALRSMIEISILVQLILKQKAKIYILFIYLAWEARFVIKTLSLSDESKLNKFRTFKPKDVDLTSYPIKG